MTIGQKIRYYRKLAGLTQAELAQRIGYNDRSTIAKLESNVNDASNMPASVFKKLADILHVSPGELLSENEPKKINGIKPLRSTYTVPRLGNIACGSPIYAEENFDGTDEVPEELRNIDFTLVCKGDSMIDARIHDGDIVYLREQPTVENGEIAAVLIDDEATLKRFYRHGDTVSLVAANPAYPPMVFKREEINHLRIIGLAVAFTSRIET